MERVLNFFTKHAPVARGFTLIELMVALTLFSVVMTVSIGTLLVMIDSNAKAQEIYSVMTNLSFVTDNMTRNIRTGRDHYCDYLNSSQLRDNPGGEFNLRSTQNFPGTKNCSETPSQSQSPIIVFTRMVDGENMAYRLNRDEQAIDQCIEEVGENTCTWYQITSDDVAIEDMKIMIDNTDTYAAGNGTGKTAQAMGTIIIKGRVNGSDGAQTPFTLQSRITRRILDY